jgi:hypothetical protein
LQTDEHATEVLADEVFKQAVDGITVGETMLLQDLIGKVGTGFKGQTLRQDESVVAVEEDVLDLRIES